LSGIAAISERAATTHDLFAVARPSRGPLWFMEPAGPLRWARAAITDRLFPVSK